MSFEDDIRGSFRKHLDPVSGEPRAAADLEGQAASLDARVKRTRLVSFSIALSVVAAGVGYVASASDERSPVGSASHPTAVAASPGGTQVSVTPAGSEWPEGWNRYEVPAMGIRFVFPPLPGEPALEVTVASNAPGRGYDRSLVVRQGYGFVGAASRWAEAGSGCQPTDAINWAHTTDDRILVRFPVPARSRNCPFAPHLVRSVDGPDGEKAVIYELGDFLESNVPPGVKVSSRDPVAIVRLPRGHHPQFRVVTFVFDLFDDRFPGGAPMLGGLSLDDVVRIVGSVEPIPPLVEIDPSADDGWHGMTRWRPWLMDRVQEAFGSRFASLKRRTRVPWHVEVRIADPQPGDQAILDGITKRHAHRFRLVEAPVSAEELSRLTQETVSVVRRLGWWNEEPWKYRVARWEHRSLIEVRVPERRGELRRELLSAGIPDDVFVIVLDRSPTPPVMPGSKIGR
jgi:hypothetical protein